jgi:pilus assembly protein CpaB
VSSRRVPILILAVVIAAMTALATFKYASNADQRALGDAEPVSVFVVKKDVPKGFSGARALDEGYIAKEDIPRKFYPANAVVDPQTLRGKVAIAGLAAGLPVVQSAFADPQVARESFADLIDKGHQAVTLSVSDVQAVARLVVPGDFVNLLLTYDDPLSKDPGGPKTTQNVLQKVKVVAIGNATELQPGQVANQPQTQAGVAPTAASGLMTFSLSAQDAERAIHASQMGAIHLTLVPKDFTPAPVPPVNRANLFA